MSTHEDIRSGIHERRYLDQPLEDEQVARYRLSPVWKKPATSRSISAEAREMMAARPGQFVSCHVIQRSATFVPVGPVTTRSPELFRAS